MEKKDKIQTIYEALTDILGEEMVINDSDILEKYSRDETSDLRSPPDLLVRAASAMDVSNTLKICNRYRFPVIPRGAGTGVTGKTPLPLPSGKPTSTYLTLPILPVATSSAALRKFDCDLC